MQDDPCVYRRPGSKRKPEPDTEEILRRARAYDAIMEREHHMRVHLSADTQRKLGMPPGRWADFTCPDEVEIRQPVYPHEIDGLLKRMTRIIDQQEEAKESSDDHEHISKRFSRWAVGVLTTLLVAGVGAAISTWQQAGSNGEAIARIEEIVNSRDSLAGDLGRVQEKVRALESQADDLERDLHRVEDRLQRIDERLPRTN